MVCTGNNRDIVKSISDRIWPWAYLSWPNRITLLRLVLVAPFVVLMLHQQQHMAYRYVALGIFLAMAGSDAIDGIAARRMGHASRLGAILDPLADKTLIICAAVLLALPGSKVTAAPLPRWVAVMIIGKDLWVLVGFVVVFLLTGKVRVRPTGSGKLCTVAQLVMVSAILISPDLNRLGLRAGFQLARATWFAAAALCLMAVVSYTLLGLSFLAEADEQDSEDEAEQAA